MRPVRQITDEMDNCRVVEVKFGHHTIGTLRRDPVEPEPVGTIVLMAFRITGYDRDCDGSLMARLECIDKNGEPTGWEQNAIGLYPSTELVVSLEEFAGMFEATKE